MAEGYGELQAALGRQRSEGGVFAVLGHDEWRGALLEHWRLQEGGQTVPRVLWMHCIASLVEAEVARI